MSQPLPAHQRTMIIARAKVANGYNITFRTNRGGILWQVVAAAQVDAYPELPATSVRVVVAPAQVAP